MRGRHSSNYQEELRPKCSGGPFRLSQACLCPSDTWKHDCTASQAGVYDESVKNEIAFSTKKASNMTNPASFVDHHQCIDMVRTSDQPRHALTSR